MATASLADPTRSFPAVNASVLLVTRSTLVEFALSHAAMVSSPSKEDVLFVLSTLSSELRSTAAIALLDSIRTTSVFVRN